MILKVGTPPTNDNLGALSIAPERRGGRDFAQYTAPHKAVSAEDIALLLDRNLEAITKALTTYQGYSSPKRDAGLIKENPFESSLCCGTTAFTLGTVLALNHLNVALVCQNEMSRKLYTAYEHMYAVVSGPNGQVLVDGAYKQFLTGRIPDEQLAKLPDILIVDYPEGLKRFASTLAGEVAQDRTIDWCVPQFEGDDFGSIISKGSCTHQANAESLTRIIEGIWDGGFKTHTNNGRIAQLIGEIACGMQRVGDYVSMFHAMKKTGLVEVYEAST